MDSLKTRVVHAACSSGVVRQFPLADVSAQADRIRTRLAVGRADEKSLHVQEVETILQEVARAWITARRGARAVWRGSRPKYFVRDIVARRLGGDEAAADALLTEALFESPPT